MNNNNFFFLILILIIPIGIFMYMRNKKKKQQQGSLQGNRKTRKDEVWNIVKKFLKDNDEVGKEILQLFPAKKPDPNDKSNMNKEQKKEYKKNKKTEKELKKSNPEEYKKLKKDKKQKSKNRPPENWYLYFQTWNSKSKVIDEPRILHVIVKYIKVDKKKTERKVIIEGLADFDTEFKWIEPLKAKEDKVIEKQRNINEAKRRKVIEQNRKKKEKLEQKREMQKNKESKK